MQVLKDVFNLVHIKFFWRGKSSNQTSTLQTRTNFIHVIEISQNIVCGYLDISYLLDFILIPSQIKQRTEIFPNLRSRIIFSLQPFPLSILIHYFWAESSPKENQF